jgi:uncharacterized membrane protein (UPF0127 family)
MLRIAISVVLASLIAAPTSAAPAALSTRTLTIHGAKLTVEVAATPQTRETGLMNRFSLPQDHGMLFVFEGSEPRAFWMKNTYIPLSIAFVDSTGRILNIEDMRPRDESTHWSRGPAMFAIEVRQGWFAEKGVQPGDAVEGLPSH